MMTSKIKNRLLAAAATFMLTIPSMALATPPTAEQAVALLQEGNRNYISGNLTHLKSFVDATTRTELLAGQHPYAIVLTCSDSRVPPEILFDKGLGEVFPIRVAGNVVAPHEIGSIEYAVEHLHSPLIVVLGHERCGAVSAAYGAHGTDYMTELGPNLGSLVESIDPAVTAVLGETGKPALPAEQAVQIEDCIIENAKMVAESLETSSLVLEEAVALGHVKIVQAKYDLDTGAVSFFTGVCGEANEANYMVKPTRDLCTSGAASALTPTLTGWGWTCAGTHGGGDASCSANIQSLPTTRVSVPTSSLTGSYRINWNRTSLLNANYKVEVSTDGGVNFTPFTETTNSWYDVVGQADGNYIYRVITSNTDYVDSTPTVSNEIHVALSCADIGAINLPTSSSTGAYRLGWTRSATPGVTYTVTESFNGAPATTLPTTTNNYIKFAWKANGSYVYTVTASKTDFADSAVKTSPTMVVAR